MARILDLFRRRSARKNFDRATSEFEVAAAALVKATRSARAAGRVFTPEMESAAADLKTTQQELLLAKSDLSDVTGGPPPVSLTEAVSRKVHLLFPTEQHEDAIRLLENQCARNLPYYEDADSKKLERVRFAVLKLSGGNLDELRNQVELARQDWRDALLLAERPEAMRFGLQLDKLDVESRAAIDARDRRQYDEWLHDDTLGRRPNL
jgi:hypothetical protein